MARRYARTIHWTPWKEVLNACANVGKPTLAILVPREDSNMDSERLASAHGTVGFWSVLPDTASFCPVTIDFTMNSSF
jgi:hypothetical protein